LKIPHKFAFTEYKLNNIYANIKDSTDIIFYRLCFNIIQQKHEKINPKFLCILQISNHFVGAYGIIINLSLERRSKILQNGERKK